MCWWRFLSLSESRRNHEVFIKSSSLSHFLNSCILYFFFPHIEYKITLQPTIHHILKCICNRILSSYCLVSRTVAILFDQSTDLSAEVVLGYKKTSVVWEASLWLICYTFAFFLNCLNLFTKYLFQIACSLDFFYRSSFVKSEKLDDFDVISVNIKWLFEIIKIRPS